MDLNFAPPLVAVAVLLLAAPRPAAGLPAGQSVGLLAGVDAAGGAAAPRLALEATRWLDGPLDAVAGLGLGSAPAPEVRRAPGIATTLGLRWSPGLGRWRPSLEGGGGLWLGLDGWTPSAVLQAGAGLERLLTPDLAVAARLGARWVAGAGGSVDLSLGLRLYY